MKTTFLLLALLSSSIFLKAQDGSDFFSGTSLSGQSVSAKSPIASIEAIAKKAATKTITLTAENCKDALAEARGFKWGVIIVGEHTVVKVMDFKNCHQSGSWGACMPYGEGYIKRGSMNAVKDYVNNIIGKPDSQTRTLYLFN